VNFDRDTVHLFEGVAALLALASLIGGWLARRARTDESRKTIANLNARTRAWWVMVIVFVASMAVGRLGATVLFGLTSLLALREFVTLTPTRRGDHRALFWAFFVVAPLQYVLVGLQWYGLFTVMIPVYAFLILPLRSALAGDTEHFLERAAKIQWGLMLCVYCVSHVPALLMLRIEGYERQNAKLLFFLVAIGQMSDVLQYVFGKLFGHRPIAPTVSPNKTWAGFVGGAGCAVLIGTGLWWITPFTPREAAGMALVIVLLGFAGGLVMSAIKRDRHVKDFGTLIEGHGGVLDRIDSLCFAAPVFFHLVRWLHTS
jgi:phosphatidate cytidylyltransferase